METKTGEPPKISRREVLRQGLFVGISSTALLAQKYWEFFNYKKLASEFAGGDPSWVYQSYILRPPNSGEVITHENLKKLAV